MEQLHQRLIELKEIYNASGIKIEFESEYYTPRELLKFRESAYSANLAFAVKLGGFSSFSDLFKAKELNSDIIIAPMVETSYALQKFIETYKNVFINEEKKPRLYISIETKTALQNIEEIFNSKYISDIHCIIFGRGDFINSFEIENIEDDKVLQIAKIIQEKTYKYNKKMTIGGEITPKSAVFLSQITPDYTETRKIIFNSTPSEIAIEKAIEFEREFILKKENLTPADLIRLENLKERIMK